MKPGLPTCTCPATRAGAIVHHGVLDPGLAFIAKPLRPADLTRKVREVLDTPRKRLSPLHGFVKTSPWTSGRATVPSTR